MSRMLGTILKIVISVIWIPALIFIFKDQILAWIHCHPTLACIYDFASAEVTAKSYIGAIIIQSIANLIFIVFMPKYIVFYYFISENSGYPILLALCSAAGMFIAMMINYLLGFCLGFLGRFIWKDSFKKVETFFSRFGGWLILIGYFFPLGFPCTLLSFVSGTSRYSIVKYTLATMAGCVIYFTILLLCKNWLQVLYEKSNTLF